MAGWLSPWAGSWDPGSAVKPKWRPFTPRSLYFLTCEMGSECECQPGAWDSVGGLSAGVSPSLGSRRDTKKIGVSSWEGSCPGAGVPGPLATWAPQGIWDS